MSEIIELRKCISKFIDSKIKLEDKIDAKLDAVDQDETKLGTHKASVTTWRNKIAKIEADIARYETEIETLRSMKTETTESTNQVQSGGGTSPLSKELKTLQHDFSTHPRFSQKLDVAVFTRHMQVLYDTHVADCTGLEGDFVKLVECHIDTSYRVQLQRYVDTNGKFTSWSDLKEYLVETHRSCTTLFQEMSKFTNLPMRMNESVKEFCQRVETAADEAQTIILSKIKEQTEADATVQNIFELMKMDSVVRQMQAHHKYRNDYNMIVNSIDSCITLDMLSQKASKIADRKVHVDEMAEPKAYMNIKSDSKPSPDPMLAMEKRMDKMMAMIAQGQNQHVPTPKEKTDKRKSNRVETRNEKWKDPEYRAKVANTPCFYNAKGQNCTRPNCPFLPCNKNSTSKSYYSKDF